ncbi:LLM class flavin-dependent oxidoreductase [Paraflavitalea soli]|uniref:Luciferase-like monooxygenase n=1 Tax=Paraflavitalea soli TaxID=2315862 RepID=A0A3B7MUK1_9BACT|nr:LLM class flavin-dependent oxidoreductase [Paraflavitalea soli]AXY76750.1 LLM class flavin-dependent oxidoreductase [Paraflavitalea soli]
MSLQLSVLDQTPIRRGGTAVESLQESIQLARLADKLGYTRYWLSEHHNSATLAMAAPEILIARLAGETNYIRFGSGGIMLPNHSALKVAENFRLLEALYPNRIDLGLGRAPGGDRISAQLLNPSNTFDPQEYIRQIRDLQNFLTDTPAEGNAQGKVKAIPIVDTAPELWMLTSSGESGYLAAHAGMALSYAQFINPIGGAAAVASYRQRFRPSAQLSAPQANVGIFAFCSESERKVQEVQAVMDYRLLSFEKGQYNEMPTYEIAKAYNYTPGEWQRVLFNRGRMVIGTPDVVKEKITALTNEFDVEEVVIATFAEQAEDRFRSYELFSEVFELAERQTRQFA